MLCTKCHKNEAALHFTPVVAGEAQDTIHLCKDCAPTGTNVYIPDSKKLEDRPLQMATCAHCGVKFFFPNPDIVRRIVRVQTHKQEPVTTEGHKIQPFDCLRCGRPQFIEIFYES